MKCRFEEYYQKYGEPASMYHGFLSDNNPLAVATHRVVETSGEVEFVARELGVDPQQLWDNVQCQREHNRWLDNDCK